MSAHAARTAWSRATKVKAGVWATGLAAVIIVGTLTGAQLKQDQQKEQVRNPSPLSPTHTCPSGTAERVRITLEHGRSDCSWRGVGYSAVS